MTTSLAALDEALGALHDELGDGDVLSEGMSNVELTTSPWIERSMSVTSSGRSSTSRHMRWTSGLFAEMAAAMSLSTVVLPAFGGETIRPRWPLPIGATMSMVRAVMNSLPCSMRRRSSG